MFKYLYLLLILFIVAVSILTRSEAQTIQDGSGVYGLANPSSPPVINVTPSGCIFADGYGNTYNFPCAEGALYQVISSGTGSCTLEVSTDGGTTYVVQDTFLCESPATLISTDAGNSIVLGTDGGLYSPIVDPKCLVDDNGDTTWCVDDGTNPDTIQGTRNSLLAVDIFPQTTDDEHNSLYVVGENANVLGGYSPLSGSYYAHLLGGGHLGLMLSDGMEYTMVQNLPTTTYDSTVTGSGTDRWKLKSDGSIQHHAYGSGSFLGTIEYMTAYDNAGNLIEADEDTASAFIRKECIEDVDGDSQICVDDGADSDVATFVTGGSLMATMDNTKTKFNKEFVSINQTTNIETSLTNRDISDTVFGGLVPPGAEIVGALSFDSATTDAFFAAILNGLAPTSQIFMGYRNFTSGRVSQFTAQPGNARLEAVEFSGGSRSTAFFDENGQLSIEAIAQANPTVEEYQFNLDTHNNTGESRIRMSEQIGNTTIETIYNVATIGLATLTDQINGIDVLVREEGGDLIAQAYPSGRDDTTATPPTNYLYTDGSGRVLSAPEPQPTVTFCVAQNETIITSFGGASPSPFIDVDFGICGVGVSPDITPLPSGTEFQVNVAGVYRVDYSVTGGIQSANIPSVIACTLEKNGSGIIGSSAYEYLRDFVNGFSTMARSVVNAYAVGDIISVSCSRNSGAADVLTRTDGTSISIQKI